MTSLLRWYFARFLTVATTGTTHARALGLSVAHRDPPGRPIEADVATVGDDQLRVGVPEVDVEDQHRVGVVLPHRAQQRLALLPDVLLLLRRIGAAVEVPRLRAPNEHRREPLQEAALAHVAQDPVHLDRRGHLFGGLQEQHAAVEGVIRWDEAGLEQPRDDLQVAAPGAALNHPVGVDPVPALVRPHRPRWTMTDPPWYPTIPRLHRWLSRLVLSL